MRIGIPLGLSQEGKVTKVNSAYIDMLHRCDFEVMCMPQGDMTLLQLCDGLLLPGGIDVNPVFYGIDNKYSMSVDPEKDAFERDLLYAATGLGMPVFGICRGFQLIALEFMSNNTPSHLSFLQNINYHSQVTNGVKRTTKYHSVFNVDTDTTIRDRISINTPIRDSIYGQPTTIMANQSSNVMFVNSLHHQGVKVKRTASTANYIINGQFTILGVSKLGLSEKSNSYLVEAYKLRFLNSNVMCVQWHPEEIDGHEVIVRNHFNGITI